VTVMQSMTDTLGCEDRLTLNTMNKLAVTYGKQGRFQKAVELHLAVLEGVRTAFGNGSLQTIRVMANLADMYVSQLQWNQAEELLNSTLAMKTRSLDIDDLDSMIMNITLSSVYLVSSDGKRRKDLHWAW